MAKKQSSKKNSKKPAKKVAAKKPARAAKPAATKDAAPAKTPKQRDSRIPAVGTLIARPYKGKTIEVLVREDDFLHDGTSYSSLSALATKLADGSPKNGLLWFGLTKRATPTKDAAPEATPAAEPVERAKRHAKTRVAKRDPAPVVAGDAAAGIDAPCPEV